MAPAGRPRLRRWALPILLALATAASAAAALALGAPVAAAGGEGGGRRLITPVLSARRVPSLVAAPVAARRLDQQLEGWLATQPPDTCLAVGSEDGTLTRAHQGDRPLVPASGAKLLTTTAAVLALGEDHRYRTSVTTAAPAAEGVVGGDVALVGGGDPVLATPAYAGRFRRQPRLHTDLDALAAAVAAAGVRRIEGSVVGDESRYDTERYVAGWPRRYIDQHQTGPLSALSVNDGFARYPAAPGDPTPLEAAPDPAAHAARVFTDLLGLHGVEVAGPPRAGSSPAGARELAGIDSPSLREIVGHVVRESDNTAAELLLKELGHREGDPSTAGGAAAAARVLAGAGIDMAGVHLADGSGLSLENRVSCGVLLELVAGEPPAPAVLDGLPVAGESGTLADRFEGTELEDRMRAKTGTLDSVTSLTGVVEDGEAVAFSLIVNVPGGRVTGELVAAQQELGAILLHWPEVPEAALLGPEMPPAGARPPGSVPSGR